MEFYMDEQQETDQPSSKAQQSNDPPSWTVNDACGLGEGRQELISRKDTVRVKDTGGVPRGATGEGVVEAMAGASDDVVEGVATMYGCTGAPRPEVVMWWVICVEAQVNYSQLKIC
jgi:hypothetical protein